MNTFAYVRPRTLQEAVELLLEHGSQARLLTGGTDLLVRIRHGHITPRLVIDLKRIADMPRDIQWSDSAVQIGALTVMTDIIQDARMRSQFPALVEAAAVVGSVQIRNRATLAGNICNASPAADTAPPLLVYGAVVHISGSQGERQIPLKEFFKGPGQTVLQRGEIVTALRLPLPEDGTGAAFYRITRRRGVDLATVNGACLVRPSGQATFAFGAAAPRPFLAHEPSGRLSDPQIAQANQETLFHKLLEQASPISDVRASKEYRQAMLLVVARRALKIALARRQGQKMALFRPFEAL
jgi:CO/xanthine dehydrogenase FAD-binding subunit